MDLLFKVGVKQASVTLQNASEAKLYAVPASYSQDGFCVALWGKGELEPVPASLPSQTELLAHVALVEDESGASLVEHFCREGVSYAQN